MPHLARHFIKLLPVLAVACALVAPSAALAGNNGQQIQLCPNLTVSNGFAYVIGPNQNGVTTVSPVFALGEASNDIRYQTGCRTINGYWWKGTVKVYWYRANGDLYTGRRRPVLRPDVEPVHELQDVHPSRRLI
jgi:hypothetical protein